MDEKSKTDCDQKTNEYFHGKSPSFIVFIVFNFEMNMLDYDKDYQNIKQPIHFSPFKYDLFCQKQHQFLQDSSSKYQFQNPEPHLRYNGPSTTIISKDNKD